MKDHEYTNMLHTLRGLVELGRHDDLAAFVSRSVAVQRRFGAGLSERVRHPVVLALLLGKAAVAAERGVELRIAADSRLDDDPDAVDLVTVVGNLVDNALDAAAAAGEDGWVEVAIVQDHDGIVVRVRDSGAGVDESLIEEIFRDGFSTKAPTRGVPRGVGLALVRRLAHRRGGRVTVENDGGALFTVYLPARLRAPGEPVAGVTT